MSADLILSTGIDVTKAKADIDRLVAYARKQFGTVGMPGATGTAGTGRPGAVGGGTTPRSTPRPSAPGRDPVVAAMERQNRAIQAQARIRDNLAGRLRRQITDERVLEHSLKRLEQASAAYETRLRSGALSADQLRRANLQLGRSFDVLRRGVTAQYGLFRKLDDQFDRTRRRMSALDRLVLRSAGINALQQIIATGNIGQAALVQGPEISDVLVRNLGRGRLLAGGGILAALGLTAAGVGNIAGAEAAMRDFAQAIRLAGRQGEITAAQLDSIAEAVDDLPGIGRAAARELTAGLARVRTLSSSLIDDLALLSADLGAALGEAPADAAINLARALGDPAEAAKDLQSQIAGLDEAFIRSLQAMQDQGRAGQAQAALLERLEDLIGGIAEKSQGPWARAFDALGNAWREVLDAFSNLGPIRWLAERLEQLANATADLFSKFNAPELERLQDELSGRQTDLNLAFAERERNARLLHEARRTNQPAEIARWEQALQTVDATIATNATRILEITDRMAAIQNTGVAVTVPTEPPFVPSGGGGSSRARDFGDVLRDLAEDAERLRRADIDQAFALVQRAVESSRTPLQVWRVEVEQARNALELLASNGIRVTAGELDALNRTLADRRPTQGLVDGLSRAAISYGDLQREAVDFSSAFANGMDNAARALSDFFLTGKASAGDFFRSILSYLSELAIRQAVLGPLSSVLGGLLGNIPWGGGGLSAGESAMIARFSARAAMGEVFSAGNVVHAFARGGIVDRPSVFPMATGVGLMGEAGPEAVMPLARTSTGHLGVRAAGGPVIDASLDVQIINEASGKVDATARETRGPDGRRVLQVFIREETKRALGEGQYDNVMSHRYGVAPARVKR